MTPARLFLLLVPFLPAPLAGAEEEAKKADFSAGALQERADHVRSTVAEVLGVPFEDPVKAVVMNRTELTKLLAAEAFQLRSGLKNGPRGEGLEAVCRIEAASLSHVVFGKVPLDGDVIHIVPANLEFGAGLDPAFAGLDSRDFLDVILIHEMVHVYQARRFGRDKIYGSPETMEEFRARTCVAEGHAQYVTKRAAKRLGLQAAFDLLVRTQTHVPDSVEDPTVRAMLEALQANFGFAYLDGAAFYEAIAAKLGDKTLPTLIERPPTTFREISHPGEYLNPAPAIEDPKPYASLVSLLFQDGEAARQSFAFPEPVLRKGLGFLDKEQVDRAMKVFKAGTVVMVTRPGAQFIFAAILLDSPAGADVFLTAEVDLLKKKDELLSAPGGAVQVVEAAYTDVVSPRRGVFANRSLRLRGQTDLVDAHVYILKEGALVYEINALGIPGAAQRVPRIIARALAVMDAARALPETHPLLTGARDAKALRELETTAEGDAPPALRICALRALSEADAATGSTAARARLTDGAAGVRLAALEILGKDANPETLRRFFEDPDWEVRERALGKILAGRKVDERLRAAAFSSAVIDKSKLIRTLAREWYESFEEIPWIEPEDLRKILVDRGPHARELALFHLGREPWNSPWASREAKARLASVVLPAVLAMASDKEAETRHDVFYALAQFADDPRVVKAFLEGLNDSDPEIVRTVLVQFDWATEQIPAVRNLLGHKDLRVRSAAANAIADLTRTSDDLRVLEVLYEGIANGTSDERAACARRLAELGQNAAVPKLIALLNGTEEDREAAREGLPYFGTRAVPALIGVLRNGNLEQRRGAIFVLGEIGEDASPALPMLKKIGEGTGDEAREARLAVMLIEFGDDPEMEEEPEEETVEEPVEPED